MILLFVFYYEIDICKENELESTVVDYFNKDGFQQVRQLIETTIRREMAVSFSSSQTVFRNLSSASTGRFISSGYRSIK